MRYKDAYGMPLQYGDIVKNIYTNDIGMIVRSSVNDTPVLYVLKEFSRNDLNYRDVEHNGARVCYERAFLHTYSPLYWRLHHYRVPNIEFLKHGDRNRRHKEI